MRSPRRWHTKTVSSVPSAALLWSPKAEKACKGTAFFWISQMFFDFFIKKVHFIEGVEVSRVADKRAYHGGFAKIICLQCVGKVSVKVVQ